MDKALKIIGIQIENFKRVNAVFIKPDGTLALITGRNGQGKTSVLDAIWATLAGAAAAPSLPIRKGAQKAAVTVDLGDLKVTRKWVPDRTSLVVESKDGASYKSPQAVLDKLVGKLSFDPLAFSRMEPKKQAATLRELTGVDTSALEAKRRDLFTYRTTVNRDLGDLESQLKAYPEVEAPDEEVSVTDLAHRQEAVIAEGAALEKAARIYEKSLGDIGTAEWRLKAAHDGVAAAKRALEAAERKLADEQASLAQQQKVTEIHKADLDAIDVKAIEGRLAEIRKAIAEADEVNRRVRAKKARAQKSDELAKKQAASDQLTAKISEIDEQIGKKLEEAKFPVPGLSFDGDTVTFQGVPFDQASSAEQIRVGLAIGAQLNPKLRVILVRDGSLLDKDGLELVARFAEEHDLQVIMERVADDGAGVGVVIEDGMVKTVACDGDHGAPRCSDPQCWLTPQGEQPDLEARS